MIRFLKHIFFLLFIFNMSASFAQNGKTPASHKVETGETVYSISRRYGLTKDDLRNANPGTIDSNYGVKAGSVIIIPAKGAKAVRDAKKNGNTLNIGVMLPLNNTSTEGKNMVEYYRGILMACNELKKENFNINVHAWNVAKNTDIESMLKEKGAADCNVIFGPYYSNQIPRLGTFASTHNIRLAVPFAPGGNEILNNSSVFTLGEFNPTFDETACQKLFSLFGKTNPIIVDCNDAEQPKGDFTSTARKYFDSEDIKYSITNINSDEKKFTKAFKKSRQNIVILNSASMKSFDKAIARVKAVRKDNPELKILVLGYHEWFTFEKYRLADFAASDVYIPTYFYYNSQSAATKKIESDYYRWFKSKMLQTTPRYALMGYDHAMYFLRGMSRYGSSFNGAKQQSATDYVQMPMHFDRVSADGGYRNTAFMFIHYKDDQSIESIAY